MVNRWSMVDGRWSMVDGRAGYLKSIYGGLRLGLDNPNQILEALGLIWIIQIKLCETST